MIFLRNLWRWLGRFWRWLTETKPVAVPLAAAVVAVAALLLPAPFPPSKVEDRLRYCGIAFELCGLYIVFSGIENRLKLFADKGMVARALDWFRRFPPFHPRQIRMSAEGKAGGIAKQWDTSRPGVRSAKRHRWRSA